MNILMTGATGFIARHLIPKLRASGHQLRTLGRRPLEGLSFFEWNSSREPPPDALESCGAVIHLAGETVAQRWTPEAKRRMRESRIEGTRHLVAALSKTGKKPPVLLSASAVGIYGSRGDELLTEESAHGSGFLAGLTEEWEAATRAAEPLGIRVVNLRFGLVLGRDGGALPKMLTPFRLGLGGKLASGRQWTPWVHIEDVADLIVFAIGNGELCGAVNVTAPNPVTNADFTRALAAALDRPGFMTVPAFALKLALGEMSEAVLSSTRVVPAAAQAAGFHFTYPELETALRDLR
jgi:uncharacterized protein (TIGR01777 family)